MSGGPAPSLLLPQYEWRPAWWCSTPARRKLRKLPTPDKLLAAPIGIVLHSGEKGPGTAEWAWKVDRTTGLGMAWYWAHFAWWHAKKCYVQTDYLDAWAPHGGIYNRYAIGVEMAGPWNLDPRPDEHRIATVQLVKDIISFCPTVGWATPLWLTGHMCFDKNKFDPGPGVKADWFNELVIDVRLEWVGESLLPKAA